MFAIEALLQTASVRRTLVQRYGIVPLLIGVLRTTHHPQTLKDVLTCFNHIAKCTCRLAWWRVCYCRL